MGKTNQVAPVIEENTGNKSSVSQLPSIDSHIVTKKFDPDVDPNSVSPVHGKSSKVMGNNELEKEILNGGEWGRRGRGIWRGGFEGKEVSERCFEGRRGCRRWFYGGRCFLSI